jgi:hypothetical protein
MKIRSRPRRRVGRARPPRLALNAQIHLSLTTRRAGRCRLAQVDSFDREAAALGRDPRFRAFLAARAAQVERVALETLEARPTPPRWAALSLTIRPGSS